MGQQNINGINNNSSLTLIEELPIGKIYKQEQSQKLYFLKQYAFTSQEGYQQAFVKFSKKLTEKNQNILNLQKTNTKIQNTFCSTFYKIILIFQYIQHSLQDQIHIRNKQNRNFQQKQIWSILFHCTLAISYLRKTDGFQHSAIFLNDIKLTQDGVIKLIPKQMIGISQQHDQNQGKTKSLAMTILSCILMKKITNQASEYLQALVDRMKCSKELKKVLYLMIMDNTKFQELEEYLFKLANDQNDSILSGVSTPVISSNKKFKEKQSNVKIGMSANNILNSVQNIEQKNNSVKQPTNSNNLLIPLPFDSQTQLSCHIQFFTLQIQNPDQNQDQSKNNLNISLQQNNIQNQQQQQNSINLNSNEHQQLSLHQRQFSFNQANFDVKLFNKNNKNNKNNKQINNNNISQKIYNNDITVRMSSNNNITNFNSISSDNSINLNNLNNNNNQLNQYRISLPQNKFTYNLEPSIEKDEIKNKQIINNGQSTYSMQKITYNNNENLYTDPKLLDLIKKDLQEITQKTKNSMIFSDTLQIQKENKQIKNQKNIKLQTFNSNINIIKPIIPEQKLQLEQKSKIEVKTEQNPQSSKFKPVQNIPKRNKQQQSFGNILDENASFKKNKKTNPTVIQNEPNIIKNLNKQNLQDETQTTKRKIQNIKNNQQTNINKKQSVLQKKNQQSRVSLKSNATQPNRKVSIQNYQLDQNLQYVSQTYQKGQYKGYKLNGLRHGTGTFFYKQGGKYVGEWKQNKMNGKGTLYYPNNQIAYQGNWKDDQLHGYGTLYNQQVSELHGSFQYQDWQNVQQYWIKYQGQFNMDNKEGKGKWYLSNGQVFEGHFKQDMVDGEGVLSRENGSRIRGIWRKNKLMRLY